MTESDPTLPDESDPVVAALLGANRAFYKHVTDGDLAAMTRLWIHSPDAMCIHPSGLVLREWKDIEKSWSMIFKAGPPKVIPETERVTVRGDKAAVFCVERIISQNGMGLAAATNLFEKQDGEWRMYWHHSSLLPSMM